jgi:hypothetical protein
MSGPELDLGPFLRDACQGKSLPVGGDWAKEYDLAGSLNTQKSGNIDLMAEACKLREFERQKLPLSDPRYRRCVENWDAYYKASEKTFMGDEFGLGVIYSSWHFLSNLSTFDWAARHFPKNPGPVWWLATYWRLVAALRCPDGRILKIGQRAGGHVPKPGLLELFHAMAIGAPDLTREIQWCHEASISLKPHVAQGKHFDAAWEYDAAVALKGALQRSMLGIDYAAPLPGVAVPFHVKRAQNGEACAWIERTGNQNTTAVLGATWDPLHGAQYLPPDGGPRIRENTEHAFCDAQGAFLSYTSNLQGQHSLPLSPALQAAPTVTWGPIG